METPKKICFVTIGATAGFQALLRATLSPSFLTVLKEYRYTDLRLQYGQDGRGVLEQFEKSQDLASNERYGFKISGFDFNKHGLEAEMRAAKRQGQSTEGVVVSHAGIPDHSADPPSVVLPRQ